MSNKHFPSFFRSLIESCYNADFYRDLKNSPFLRSLRFLLLFSLLLSILSLAGTYLFLSRIEFSTEEALKIYDEYIPSFEASFRQGVLDTSPQKISLYLSINENGNLIFSKVSSPFSRNLAFHINTTESIAESLMENELEAGIFVFRDGIYTTSGTQSYSYTFSEMNLELPAKFNKAELAVLIEEKGPFFFTWARRTILISVLTFSFFYVFVGGLILAGIFSLLGIVVLKLMRKDIDYSYLISLSFYCMVPAVLIFIVTSFFGILVPFLPLLIYGAYYYQALRQS